MIQYFENGLLLEDGAVFRNLQVVPESLVRTNQGSVRLHNWKGLFRIQLTFKKAGLNRSVTYLKVHTSYRGYYHWLLECLPRLLEGLRAAAPFTLLLPASYTDTFYIDTLRLLGVTKVEWLYPNTVYKVPRLALAYFEETMGNYSAQALHQLKHVMLEAIKSAPAPHEATRLYISRRQATRRKVLNEAEVEQVLKDAGFQIFCFEDYAFEEQVRLCAAADVLVGIHGAGLSNMVFLQEKATVVEFRKFDGGENYFFERLATTLSHEYHLLYCAAGDEQQSVQDADLVVDVQALREILGQLPPLLGAG